VTAADPIAESAMAVRNPPWTTPTALANASAAVIDHTVCPGRDLSTQVRPRVTSQCGGMVIVTSRIEKELFLVWRTTGRSAESH
jgi:hypothetical protein